MRRPLVQLLITAFACVAVSVLGGAAEAKPSKGQKGAKKGGRRGPYGASSRVERPAEARGTASLRVRSIDFQRRLVVVEVGGFPKAPAGNLFTFTDDRGRKFIAVNAVCEAPFPSGIRVCDLTTPENYERHPWVGLELHLHGLTSNTVAAPREEVERAYEAARAIAELQPSAPPVEAAEKPAEPPKPLPVRPDSPDPSPGVEGEDGEVEEGGL